MPTSEETTLASLLYEIRRIEENRTILTDKRLKNLQTINERFKRLFIRLLHKIRR